MMLITAQVVIAIFTLSPPHFTPCPRNRDKRPTTSEALVPSPVQGFPPPAFFNYISKVKKLPLARYYSVSELSLIPDTTNKYLMVGARCRGAAEGLLSQPSPRGASRWRQYCLCLT